jgi:hypothetical protein
VLERSLDSPVSLTQRELLALSPDLRRHIKDLTTTKRIPTVSTATATFDTYYQTTGTPSERKVASDSLPLRVVEAIVEDRLRCECILDQGAQVTAMRKDLWERLGLPLKSDMVMVMEAANDTRSTTLGLLQDLKFAFGPVEICLQVQVVEKAPFEVLLGRPFFALTACFTKDFQTGDQHITITDPNTRQVVTIPTQARVYAKPRGQGDVLLTGFP